MDIGYHFVAADGNGRAIDTDGDGVPDYFEDNCASGAFFNTTLFCNCASVDASEEHNVGEVWCVTLWEARRNLIARYGGTVGNQIMLQLVTTGMILCPPNPNFIQARDAFFDAVEVSNYCADNWADLWAAFSKRGMGGGASSPESSTTFGVVESFAGGPISPCQTE